MILSKKMHPSQRLLQFRSEAEQELKNILSWWTKYSVDHGNGGFFGKIDNENNIDADAAKGSVLNGRILWTFSSAYIFFKDPSYLETATRAYDYITGKFIDPNYGGVFWTVNAKGQPAETKKQVYANAFVLYGLSEYFRASENEDALQHAIKLYYIMAGRAHDEEDGGFFEAFSREWDELIDQRLSGKDANEKKSMNTNLHVLEAFANLYLIWPDENLKHKITELLKIFAEKIIDPAGGHLHLFFDEEWNKKPHPISYGHDIEAAWLLAECAAIIKEDKLTTLFKEKSVSLALGTMKGLDADGGLWYEYDLNTKKLIREKHWWPQAEAMVGFFNGWQVTGDQRFLEATLNCWNFITTRMLNPSGEWYWGIDSNNKIMNEDKAGLWKCPYHNSRACLEIIKRTDLK